MRRREVVVGAEQLRHGEDAGELYRVVQLDFTPEIEVFLCCLGGVLVKIGWDLSYNTQNTSISGVKSSWTTL